METNPDAEDNRNRWKIIEDGEWGEGYVLEIQQNGFGTFMSKSGNLRLGIKPDVVKSFSLRENDPIRITFKGQIKNHIIKIEKL